MARTKRVLAVFGAVGGGVALLAMIALLVLTRTDWGRERVRAFSVGKLASQVAGRVAIGKLSGNLLTGATIVNIEIADSSGAPFLRADTLSLRYSLRSFLSKHLVFRDVRIVNPLIVLDQRPGGEWNFLRLFPQDTAAQPDTVPGFGSWLRIEDIAIHNGTVVVRMEWQPADSLTGAARERAIEAALSERSRPWIVTAAGGYQMVSMIRDVFAELPLMRLADPDSAARVFEVASLSATALPFRPPGALIHDLAGRFVMTDDSLFFERVQLALPETRVKAEGGYALTSGGLRALVRAAPFSFADVRWLLPELPDGGGEVALHVERDDASLGVRAERINIHAGGATLVGHANIRIGDTLRIGDTELSFAQVDTRLIQQLAPGVAIPVSGIAAGRLALRGQPAALAVNGWAEFRQRNGSTSRIVTAGAIGTVDGLRAEKLRLQLTPLRLDLLRNVAPDLQLAGYLAGGAVLTGSTADGFTINADLAHIDPRAGRSRVIANGMVLLHDAPTARALRLRLEPMQIALLRPYVPDLPINGTIGGTVTVNGSAASRVTAALDLVVNDETGRSHLVGNAIVVPNSGPGFDVDLRARALSLATVGAFAPGAGLQGTASGRIGARGTPAAFAFDADLELADRGALAAQGNLSRNGTTLGYDVRAVVDSLDASAASTRAPQTALTGTLSLRGAGTDPATMNATIAAHLVDTRLERAPVDTTRIDATLGNGLARIDRAQIRFASARVDAEGSLGLIEGRTGEVRYRVAVDSLADFAAWIPGDTTAAPPRPAQQARRIAQARADSLRIYRETEVERAARGYPPPPTLEVDVVRAIPTDSVAGTIYSEGVIAGNVRRLDARGTLTANNVVAAGFATDSAHASVKLLNVGTSAVSADVRLNSNTLRARGFSFDSTRVHAEYSGSSAVTAWLRLRCSRMRRATIGCGRGFCSSSTGAS